VTNHRGALGINPPATQHPTCPPCPLSLGQQVVKTTPDHKPGGEWHHCEPVVSPVLEKSSSWNFPHRSSPALGFLELVNSQEQTPTSGILGLIDMSRGISPRDPQRLLGRSFSLGKPTPSTAPQEPCFR
jgi:hypothetical protein